MAEGTNMICPSCGAFQPRAEVCNKCGIIVAKASTTATSTPAGNTVAAKPGKPPVAIIAVAVVVVAVIGYFLFSGSGTDTRPAADTAQTKPAAKKSEIDRIGTFNASVADKMHRTNVLSKLSEIRKALNMYSVEGNTPPGNAAGLQVLVDKGLLPQSGLTDEWGNPFVYQLKMERDPATGKDYTISLSSMGPDGIAGNADDIKL